MCYHGDVPCFDDVDVPHQVLPGHQTLQVHEHGLPHQLQLLEVSIQSKDQDIKVRVKKKKELTQFSRERCCLFLCGVSLFYPATLFTASLLVGGTRKQMDGTEASLPVSFSTCHLKGLELLSRAHSSPLWTVICRRTSQTSVFNGKNNKSYKLRPKSSASSSQTLKMFNILTSICLKSQTAWMGILPFSGVVGLRGFSWMTVFARLFRASRLVLNSASCSFSSW